MVRCALTTRLGTRSTLGPHRAARLTSALVAETTLVTVPLEGGRTLEVAVAGDEGAPALVFHHGTPGSALRMPLLVDAALERGWRYVAPTRAGYGASSREEGRDVGAAARDVAEMLDRLGHGEFVTMGWSGGGPHALACAGLLGGRCRAAASLSGVAPSVEGFDFTEGMGQDNVVEFEFARKGGVEFQQFLDELRDAILSLDADAVTSVSDVFGDLIGAADAAAATPEYAAAILRNVQAGVANGVAGWFDDDVAFLEPWGFALHEVEVPVSIWYGTGDLMVPTSNGDWLVEHVKGARAHRLEGEGHFSYAVTNVADIFDELGELAGAPW